MLAGTAAVSYELTVEEEIAWSPEVVFSVKSQNVTFDFQWSF